MLREQTQSSKTRQKKKKHKCIVLCCGPGRDRGNFCGYAVGWDGGDQCGAGRRLRVEGADVFSGMGRCAVTADICPELWLRGLGWGGFNSLQHLSLGHQWKNTRHSLNSGQRNMKRIFRNPLKQPTRTYRPKKKNSVFCCLRCISSFLARFWSSAKR